MICWSGSCLPNLQKFAQTAKQNGLDIPIITDANHYEADCAAANTDGAMDNLYIRFAFVPFEEADVQQGHRRLRRPDRGRRRRHVAARHAGDVVVPALGDGGLACGDALTRAVHADQPDEIHSWTGTGCTPRPIPAATTRRRATPCSSSRAPPTCGSPRPSRAPSSATRAGSRPSPAPRPCRPLKLDADRISQQFATGG